MAFLKLKVSVVKLSLTEQVSANWPTPSATCPGGLFGTEKEFEHRHVFRQSTPVAGLLFFANR